MSNFIDNVVFFDSTAAYHMKDNVMPTYKGTEVGLKNMSKLYYLASPNFFMIAFQNGKMLQYTSGEDNSDEFNSMMMFLAQGLQEGKQEKTIKEYFEVNYSEVYDNTYMHIAPLFAVKYKQEEEVLTMALDFITTATNNGVKILSFIFIALFCFYTKNSKIKPNKWMVNLRDKLMDGEYDGLLKQHVTNTDKRKFIIMIMQYLSLGQNEDYGYRRLRELDECFITKIDKTPKQMPGETPDHLFLISYDFFIRALKLTWTSIFMNVCYAYMDAVPVNIITSWMYFSVKNDKVIELFGLKRKYKKNELLQKIKSIVIL